MGSLSTHEDNKLSYTHFLLYIKGQAEMTGYNMYQRLQMPSKTDIKLEQSKAVLSQQAIEHKINNITGSQ